MSAGACFVENMKTEDISNPPQALSNGFSVSERGLLLDSGHNLSDYLAGNPVDEDDEGKTEKIEIKVGDTVNCENDPNETQEGIRDWSSDMEISLESGEVICGEDKLNGQNLQVHAEIVAADVQEEQDTLTSRLRVVDGCHDVQTECYLHHSVTSATGNRLASSCVFPFLNILS